MPRKLRIEYAGATYHFISRGNYRKDLFVQKPNGETFERTIFETVQRCGWELYPCLCYYLMLCEEGDPGRRADLMNRYCRGWFTGSAKARKALAKDLAEEAPMVDWESADMRELNEARWEVVVAEEMKKSGKSESEIIHDGKSAPWKVAIAKRLRRETTAGNPWIAKRLRMGSPNYVSNLIHA